jgi:transposase
MIEQLDPEVRAYISELEESKRNLEIRYEILEEEYRLALLKRFSRSSEQIPKGQEDLFDVPELAVTSRESSDAEETIIVPAHERKKPGREPIDPKHPRHDVVHDLSEEEKHCACGHELQRIGEETTEKIQVIPEQIWIERHVRPKYACHHCEGSGDEDRAAVRIAPAPKQVLPRSIASASLIAFILINKFVDHLPFYRQEKRFARIGINLSRQDMSNWAMAVAAILEPLIDLFRRLIRAGPFVQIDETPVQVLNEPDRPNTSKSYMWLARGGPPETQVTLYRYTPHRSAEYPRTLLSGFTGYMQADGYRVYRMLDSENPDIVRVGCFAHVRRKFHDAAKASKKTGAAHEGMKYITTIYRIERELRSQELTDDELVLRRRELVEPELERFHRWLVKKQKSVVPSTLLGKAVSYALSEWDALLRYLDHAYITPDNNAAENSIRPFVLGRRNWLFSGSPRGANASCTIYSLIETAKQHALDPFAYLHYVIYRAPFLSSEEDWESVLPFNLDSEEIDGAFPKPPKLL